MPRLGPEHSALQYPIATLARLGARLSFGSDWPASSADPLAGLAVAVTRETPAGEPVGGWVSEERIPILDAVGAYTSGSAHQAFDDDRGAIADATAAGLWLDGVEVWRG